jgi:hypothetical protein
MKWAQSSIPPKLKFQTLKKKKHKTNHNFSLIVYILLNKEQENHIFNCSAPLKERLGPALYVCGVFSTYRVLCHFRYRLLGNFSLGKKRRALILELKMLVREREQ